MKILEFLPKMSLGDVNYFIVSQKYLCQICIWWLSNKMLQLCALGSMPLTCS